MNMKFTYHVYEKLIKQVKERPELYDAKLKGWRDTNRRQMLWEEVTSNMGQASMSPEDWKKLWRQKRDSFFKKYKQLINVSGANKEDIESISRGPLYDQMLFLKEYYTPPSTVVNVEFNQASDESQSLPIKTDVVSEDEYEDSLDGHEVSSPISLNLSAGSPSAVSPGCDQDEEAASVHITPVVNLDKRRKRRRKDRSYAERVGHSHVPMHSSAKVKCLQRGHDQEKSKDMDIYMFLSTRVKQQLSQSTQDWMEDEVMKLYMEAKRRDRVTTMATSSAHPQFQHDATSNAPSTSHH